HALVRVENPATLLGAAALGDVDRRQRLEIVDEVPSLIFRYDGDLLEASHVADANLQGVLFGEQKQVAGRHLDGPLDNLGRRILRRQLGQFDPLKIDRFGSAHWAPPVGLPLSLASASSNTRSSFSTRKTLATIGC